MERRERGAAAFFLGAIALVIVAAAATSALREWPLSEEGWDTIVSAATPVVAGIAAWLAYQSFRMNREAARATRLQEAAKMLGEESDATKIMAIELLRGLVVENPDRYLSSAMLGLGSLIREQRNRVFPETLASDGEILDAITKSTAPPNPVIAAALGAVDQLNRTNGSAISSLRARYATGRVVLRRLLFWRGGRRGESFAHLSMRDAILSNYSFDDCSFVDSELKGLVGLKVKFRDCDLRNAQLRLRGITGPIRASDAGVIKFERCRTDGATINGVPFQSWLDGQRTFVDETYDDPEPSALGDE